MSGGGPASGFAIEKAVVIAAGSAVVLVGTVHAAGWLVARFTGAAVPPFTPARTLALMQGRDYAPGVPLVAHAVVLSLLVAVIGFAAWRVLRWRQLGSGARSVGGGAVSAIERLECHIWPRHPRRRVGLFQIHQCQRRHCR